MFDAVWGLLLVVDNNSKAVIPPKTFLGERIMENHIIPLCLAGVDRNDKWFIKIKTLIFSDSCAISFFSFTF